MRELLLCLMTSLHVKNNLKMYKIRKRGGVDAKRVVEKQSKEFIKKEKNHVTLNIILLGFHVKIAFQKKKNEKKCWSILGKEPFLRTELSVIKSIRNFKTVFALVR